MKKHRKLAKYTKLITSPPLPNFIPNILYQIHNKVKDKIQNMKSRHPKPSRTNNFPVTR